MALTVRHEYSSDTLRTILQTPNRVGNIPMHWYDDLPHVGYDINGKKVLRPARGDELDKFLETVEDPSAWYVTAATLALHPLTSRQDLCL